MSGTFIGHEKDETLFYFFMINNQAINRIIKITLGWFRWFRLHWEPVNLSGMWLKNKCKRKSIVKHHLLRPRLINKVIGCCVYVISSRPSAVRYGVKSLQGEPNLEEGVVLIRDEMWPDTLPYTNIWGQGKKKKKRVVWCVVFRVRKASWQRGSCKMRFHHVWSAGLSLSRSLSLFVPSCLEI